MKIAIQNKRTGFHPHWLAYCKEHDIPFKLVDCYRNDIISRLSDCDAFMWHHNQSGVKDVLFAKQLLFSLEQAGKVVFPNFNTAWHFDDKVGQKYLLESLGIPLVNTYVFYDKQSAMEWVGSTRFPKVFKLRGGAGASNVRLANTKQEAAALFRKAFGRGFSPYGALGSLKERYRKYREGMGSVLDVSKGFARFLRPPEYAKILGKDVGYAYFQDYVPDNDSDIRVIIVDDKAFAIKRMVRKGDFRASGSGYILYDKEHFSDEIIALSFRINEKIRSQSLAIDYVMDGDTPMLVEISYGFSKEGYDPCVGYWDKDLNFHEGPINPCGWMVDGVVREIQQRKNS